MAENDRKVFIGGLSSSTTTDTLKAFFGQFGAVQDAHVMEYFDKRTGEKRTRGFGFIVFENAQSVDHVVDAHKMEVDGKEVEVKRIDDTKSSIEGKQELESRKIFCGGLSETVTSETLKGYFAAIDPAIVEAKVMFDPHSQRSRCFGYVTFSDKEYVAKAIANRDSNYLDGKWIDVKPSTLQEKGKGKDGKGKGGKGKGYERGWGKGYTPYGKGADPYAAYGYPPAPYGAYPGYPPAAAYGAPAAYGAAAQQAYAAAPQYAAYGQAPDAAAYAAYAAQPPAASQAYVQYPAQQQSARQAPY